MTKSLKIFFPLYYITYSRKLQDIFKVSLCFFVVV